MDASTERGALLRAVPLFAGLATNEMTAVLQASQMVDHEAGHQIVGEGEEGVGFHMIIAGEARVSQGGHELTTLRPGDYFGEIALIDGKGRSATVVAVGPARTLSIVTWRFRPLLEQYPQIGIVFLKELCERIRHAEASIIR
jgi:CRP/FNR family transcriptional regulator, cyclic AMP receptor protein